MQEGRRISNVYGDMMTCPEMGMGLIIFDFGGVSASGNGFEFFVLRAVGCE